MFVNQTQLKDFILDSGLVSKADWLSAEKESTEKSLSPERVLLNAGKITEDDLRRVQAYVLGVPFIDLKAEKIDFGVLSMIPEPIARTHNIVAFRKTDKELEVAMLDTEDLRSIEFIKKKVGLKIQPRLTDTESIKHALKKKQKTLKE